jgi:hypothetical protein
VANSRRSAGTRSTSTGSHDSASSRWKTRSTVVPSGEVSTSSSSRRPVGSSNNADHNPTPTSVSRSAAVGRSRLSQQCSIPTGNRPGYGSPSRLPARDTAVSTALSPRLTSTSTR